jgi:RNA polymerase sigma-70 factor (ECF subfamily)
MPDDRHPDAALMMKVKQGDMTAFAELVDKYKQPVINLLSRLLQDATEAEDIAQNTFIQVFRSAHRYDPKASFASWIFTIARRLGLNEIRRRSRHPADSIESRRNDGDDRPAPEFVDTANPEPPENLLRQELEQKISESLAHLPENQRTAMLLCQQSELSYEEIAGVLECSLSATKSLIFRARETLKERLKPYLKSGDWSP